MSGRVRRGLTALPSGGAKLTFDYVDSIALSLRNLVGVSDITGLQAMFGGGVTTIRNALADGLDALHKALRRCPSALVRWATFQEMVLWSRVIHSHGTAAEAVGPCPAWFPWKIFGWVDGTVFPVPRDKVYAVQRLHWSGKHKIHCISCVFVFAPDGRIIWYALNVPGTTHDSVATTDLLNKFLKDHERTPPGFCLLGDTAFRSKRSAGYWRPRNRYGVT